MPPSPAFQKYVGEDSLRARPFDAAHDRFDLGGSIPGKAVHRHNDRFLVYRTHIFDVFVQIRQALFQRGKIFLREVRLICAAVQFERLDGGDDHDAVGLDTRHAALRIEKFFRAEVCAESRLGDDPVGKPECGVSRQDAVAAVRDVGKRAAVHDGGRTFERLHQIGLDRVFE